MSRGTSISSVIISNISLDPFLTACLFVFTGSFESPETSNLQYIFFTGNKSKDDIISLIPIAAMLSTPLIVFGIMLTLSNGNYISYVTYINNLTASLC